MPSREVPWQELAACRSFGVEMFYPPTDQDGDEAKAVCYACPVRESCLDFALSAGERFGVWGGMTPQERRYLSARRRRSTAFGNQEADEPSLTVSQ